jgi:hypothetical protein
MIPIKQRKIMAITYSDLVTQVQQLEAHFGGNSTQNYAGAANAAIRSTDNFQCFALDTTTANNPNPLPVIVAVGANYCDGKTLLPNASTPNITVNSPPYVEDNLNNERKNFEAYINCLRNGNVAPYPSKKSGFAKEVWVTRNNGNDVFRNYTNAGQKEENLVTPSKPYKIWSKLPSADKYHLIMTNFCPYITHKPWRDYRDYEPWVSQELFSLGLRIGHLAALQSRINQNVSLWLGHGNFDVYYHFFTYLVRGYQPGFSFLTNEQWAFTCNSRQCPKNNGKGNGLTVFT